jgi:predicted hydrocarbon binding protein
VNKQSVLVNFEELKDIQAPAFGLELLREVLLPDILGQDHPQMLYWAGKGLARKYPVDSIEELSSFFESAGWGSLTLLHNKKSEMEFELSGELISIRLKKSNEFTFQLEAGFIAEQLQTMNKHITETYEQVKKRANKVVFTVKWDLKDVLYDEPTIGKRSERKT